VNDDVQHEKKEYDLSYRAHDESNDHHSEFGSGQLCGRVSELFPPTPVRFPGTNTSDPVVDVPDSLVDGFH